MYNGTIQCTCGALFYTESVNNTIACPTCGKVYPLSLMEVEQEAPPDGADLRK